MRVLLLLCAISLFLALAELPIGYYTFLRIFITVGSVAVIAADYKKGFNFWMIGFVLTAIVFNPLIPIYLYEKSKWIPVDIAGGILFLGKAFVKNDNKFITEELK